MSANIETRRARRRGAPVRRRTQSGASLIEVMVAVMILGIGLLGIGAMQAVALRNGQSSLERTQAVIQTYAILDVIRANKNNALAGYYNTGTTPRCDVSTINADDPGGAQSAQGDVNTWLGSLKEAMGGGATDSTTCGAISCAGNTIDGTTCTVTVQWDDSRGRGVAAEEVLDGDGNPVTSNSDGSSQRRVVTVAAI